MDLIIIRIRIITIIIIVIIIINNNAYTSVLWISPKGFRRARTYSEEDWNFPGRNYYELGCFCLTKIRLGEI